MGAGTVSLGVAFFLGSIFEILGAVYLSGEVVSSIAGANSVVNMPLYHSDNATECGLFMLGTAAGAEAPLLRERTLMLGLVTSMVASQIWQLIATYLAWPVSGTHTIISALMGFTLMEKGGRVGDLIRELECLQTSNLNVCRESTLAVPTFSTAREYSKLSTVFWCLLSSLSFFHLDFISSFINAL